MAALLLALVVALTPFLAEHNPVYAQVNMDSSLSNLTLSVGKLDPSFAADAYTYTARVSSRTRSIRVTAIPNFLGSQVKIYTDDSAFSPGSGQSITPADATLSGTTVSLPVGTTHIGIEVTALDNTTTSVYYVAVERISSGASNDATLSEFNLGGNITVSPAFDKDVTSYTALVPNTGPSITVVVVATATDVTNATVGVTSDKDSTIAGNSVNLSVGVNVITAKVTAADLDTTKTYILRVTRAAANASDDARLRSLSLSGITLSPTFDLSENIYTVNVPYRITRTTVRHAVNHSGAMATITSPDDFNALASGHQVFLGVGANPITITVTAENAVDTRIYTVTVTRAAASASGNADLTDLEIGDGTLSPGFNKDVTSYTDLVPNTPATLEVTATAHTAAAPPVVTSNKGSNKVAANTTLDANVATHVVTLDVGANVITIKVTAADLETTKTYTLTVTRAAANASDDAKLSTLTVGGKSVSVSGFDGSDNNGDEAVDYMTGVANGVSSIAISATPNHSGAMVVVKTGVTITETPGGTVDADGMVDLSIGPNNILIEVTAEDGDTVSNYFLVITRAAASASGNADLTDLEIGDGTLSPGFNKDVTSYTDLVPNTPATLEVTATAHTAAAPPIVTSNKGSNKVAANTTLDANVATHVVTLDVGANVITIKVTAADLETTKTYTLTVTRAAANASDDAKLSTLTVGGKSVSVSGFDGSDNNGDEAVDYMTGVANGVSSIAISATPNHSGAMVVVKTGVTITETPGGTVDADGMVDLSIGPNNILIEVTAEDGDTVSNYFLVITRAAASASGNADLTALTLSGITISPAFSANTTMYSADVPVNISATTVTATAGTEGAQATSVVIKSAKDDTLGSDLDDTNVAHITSHSIDLSAGANVITIMVTAQDYETMKTYTVRVVRGEVSDDATLSSLTLSDITLMPAFDPATMMYTAEVEALETTTVEAMTAHPGATVEGTGMRTLTVGENVINVTVTAEDETTETYTVTVTVLMGGTLLDRYDANDNGQIDKDELREAIIHYIGGDIDKAQMRTVIILYITG